MVKTVKTNCLQCGAEKEFRPCDIKRGHGKFCSITCSASYNNDRRKEYSLNCNHCNTTFNSKSTTAKFCSTKCKTQDRIRRLGKPIRHRNALSQRLNNLKLGITNECSNCKWNLTICDIHHIIEKCNGGSDEIDNLTILCPNCHRLAHKGLISSFTTVQEALDNRGAGRV